MKEQKNIKKPLIPKGVSLAGAIGRGSLEYIIGMGISMASVSIPLMTYELMDKVVWGDLNPINSTYDLLPYIGKTASTISAVGASIIPAIYGATIGIGTQVGSILGMEYDFDRINDKYDERRN